MGVAITELLVKREISLQDLSGKVIAVDSPLWLYQFLSSIRQPDGNLFTDSKGNVTSHLMGLFFRTIKLMESGIKLVFCFDGKVPELKKEERQRRKEIKQEAERKFAEAEKKQDIEGMKKFAARTSRLTSEMIADAKNLLEALGLPFIVGASEAEAQASFLVKRGDAFAVSTNDADALLFNAPRIIRNLNIVGKKKKTKTLGTVAVEPELIDLHENLQHLGITHDQLISLCMLVGTDYSPGVKGIGPKTALKMVKKFGQNFEALFHDAKWDAECPVGWNKVFALFKEMPVVEDYRLNWGIFNQGKIRDLLVKEYEFSEERVLSSLEKIGKSAAGKGQKGLGEFLQ